MKSNPVKLNSSAKSISQSNISINPPVKSSTMFRSASHETSLMGPFSKPKCSASDNILEAQLKESSSQQSIKKESQTCFPEDDVCSTDSSVLDESDGKKKKRKLFTFTKKNKNKGN